MEHSRQPSGARAAFADAVRDAMNKIACEGARKPTQEQIARATQHRNRHPVSKSAISAWRRGDRLPSSLAALNSFLSALEEVASLPPGRFERAGWARLYQQATNESAPEQRPQAAILRVRDADPLQLMVHRARTTADGDAVPPYIPRDIDPAVRSALIRSAEHGGAVLLVGDSTAGKTRCAFESMTSALPQHLLIVPRGAAEISEAAATAVRLSNEGERCLLWLNDMERYIGSGGLGLKDIRALLASRTVVLATMRSRIRQNFPEDELVRISEEFEVQRLWSEDELERARQQLRRRLDARLQLALTQADNFGVAETLATGPQLWKELKAASVVNGNPRGAALVWAAIDLTLAGLTDPLPVTLLETLHEDYLPGRNKSLIGPEPFEEAFLWATTPRDAVTRLLIQEGDGLRPFEYLLDAHLRERSASPQLLPEKIWNIALEAGTAEQQRFSVAFAAYANSRLDVSRRALQPLTEAGNVQALRTMGLLYEKSDRTEAARWLHLAADSGDALSLRLIGDLHFRGQNGREADNWYRKAAEAGDEVAQSYFHGPTITPYPASRELPFDPQQTEYEDGDDRDVDDYGPTPRTLRVLEAAFIMIADMAYAELESIGDNRVDLSDNYSYPFSEMPVLTWGQNHQWRHQMARCFDDLANDIKAGEWPLPTCTAEEMAMHLALEEASAMVIDDPEFVDELVRDIAEAPNDYDWDLCLTLFLEDTDVLLLFEPWSQGIEDPENHIGQRLGIAGLEADQWFVPFRQGAVRDPERGFRR